MKNYMCTVFLLFLITCGVTTVDESPASGNSRVNLAATYGSDYTSWANYYKKSDLKIDNVLAKCYDCITDKSLAIGNGERKPMCHNTTGFMSVSRDGILNVGASFLNAEPAIYKFVYPKGDDIGGTMSKMNAYGTASSYAYYSRPPGFQQQPTTYQYGNNVDAFQAKYFSNSSISGVNVFASSLSCMVGPYEQAVPMPCEYGNSYCQITNVYKNTLFSCAAVCLPSWESICTRGALSNKVAPICLVGKLSTGTTTGNAVPQMCGYSEQCQNVNTAGVIVGSCVVGCVPYSSNGTTCYYSDYGNKQGPLCYVGTFGTDAELVGCGLNDYCVRTTSGTTVTGSCASSCTASSTVVCSQVDFATTPGLVCFVGTFGDYAVATACLAGQKCQRTTEYTEFGSTITMGSCETVCVPSATTYCCNTNLCNTYASEVYYDNDKSDPVARDDKNEDAPRVTQYGYPPINKQPTYNKPIY
jgi:hypothetical protein